MNSDQSKPLHFEYRFEFENGTSKQFPVDLDGQTLNYINNSPARPEWTELHFQQCENCPLGHDVRYCPVAVNLAPLVEEFKDSVSFEKATVTVKSPDRTYVKETTLQKALSSLVGMLMVTSDCPIMVKLRPMARFHLPFATTFETMYRAISMYLTAQQLVRRKGKDPDWDLKGLVKIYKDISTVNKGISRRLSAASTKDANVNAVVILHSLGDAVPFFIESGLDELEPYFHEYVQEEGQPAK